MSIQDSPVVPGPIEPLSSVWMRTLASTSPALLAAGAAPVALGLGLLAPDLGPIILVGFLGVAGGIVSVLRPGIGLFLFTLMMYSRASEVLTTSLGVPSIAPLFTIWLLTGVVMHFGIGGLFHARPTGWQALIIYGLVLLASTLVAADAWAATYRVIDYTRELVYIALIIMCVRQLSDLRIVTRALIVAGTVPAVLTIYQVVTGSTNWFFGFGRYSEQIVVPGQITEVARPAGMVGDPNMYAMALIALIPLAFHRARWEKHLLARQLSMLAGVAIAVASILTYSRGGFLTLAVVIGCLTVTGFIKYRYLLLVGLLFLVLMPVLPESYTDRVTSITSIPRSLLSQEPPAAGTATDTSVSGRVSEIMAGVHMFLDHPLLGVGTNNYQAHFQEYARPLGIDRRANRAAHSLYVEIAAETGLVGIFAFGALIVTLFASLRRVWLTTNRGNELHDLAVIVALSLISLLVSSIFLHFAYPRFFMVFAGLAVAIASVQNWRVAPSSRLRFSRLLPSRPLLTPIQHGRMVVWGGAASLVTVVLVATLAMTLLIEPGGLSPFAGNRAAAIEPINASPMASGVNGDGQEPSGSVPGPTSTPPVVQPSDTPTPEPTPSVSVAAEAELLALAMQPTDRQPACLYDAIAHHNICGDFGSFFAANGGYLIFGHPLTEQYIIDGMPIQYFDGARFEWHAGEGDDDAYILLSRLGAQQRFASTGHEVDPPALPSDDDGCIYEDTTGHNICGSFALHWVAYGGATIFGYPITDPLEINGSRVQHFERARFELRQSADGTYELLIAPMGAEAVQRILSSAAVQDRTNSGG